MPPEPTADAVPSLAPLQVASVLEVLIEESTGTEIPGKEILIDTIRLSEAVNQKHIVVDALNDKYFKDKKSFLSGKVKFRLLGDVNTQTTIRLDNLKIVY